MDYTSIHGPGISNFSSSSPHRLPTITAARALRDLKSSSPTRCISSGVRDLDIALQNEEPSEILDAEGFYGGVSRGKVTEVYGPPGVGKTALGMQLAANALYAGEAVLWVDASHPIAGMRFSQILSSIKPADFHAEQESLREPLSVSEMLNNFTHYSAQTIAHLIAFLSQQLARNPTPNTSLLVVDGLSSLIASAFPRSAEIGSTPRKPGEPNPSARKFPVLQHLINSLQKLAASCNMAIVILSQCVTKMRQGLGAAMVPAISTPAWEQGLGCRVVLFRDWAWVDEDGVTVDDVRIATVITANGVGVNWGNGHSVGFGIGEAGLYQLKLPAAGTPGRPPTTESSTDSPSMPAFKRRKLAAPDLEIPDSEGEDDEDYGWADEDDQALPPMPPQWQGSEDILVPAPGDLEEEDVAEDEEESQDAVERSRALADADDSEDELAL